MPKSLSRTVRKQNVDYRSIRNLLWMLFIFWTMVVSPKLKKLWWHRHPPKNTFLGVPNGHNWPPRMWDMMFTHVQPMFNQFGVAGTAYGQIWPFWAKKIIFGGFWGPQMPFFWCKKGPNSPPRCEVQCWTKSNQCLTHLGSLGLPMAKYGHFGPKMAKF